MVVMGDAISITNSQNPELTRRFVHGLQRAGVTVAKQHNVTLNFAVSVTAPPTASNVVSGQYRGFEWMSGGRLEVGQRSPRHPLGRAEDERHAG